MERRNEMTQTHEKIQDRAYALWEKAGSPEGRKLEFWRQAERQLAEEAGLDISAEDARIRRPPVQAGTLAR
jgi:hypothetical protein